MTQGQARRATPLLILRPAVVTLFAATLTLGLLLPIYTDEITWKAVTARTFLDGGVNIWVFPQCAGSFAVAPPWFMLPARLIDHWLYSDLSHPESLRLGGAATLACWLLLSLVALPRFVRGGRGLPLAALGSALLGLGVLPLILIINRPEQLLRLLLTLLLVAPFALPRTRPGLVGGLVRALAIVLTATLLFAHHPKAVYFVPLILASAFYVVPGAVLRSLTATAVLFFAWSATGHWYDRLRCPEDPWVQTFIGQKMVHPSDLVPGLGGITALSALSSVRGNVLRSSRYVSETFIWGTYNGTWLPRSEPPPLTPAVNAAVATMWIGVALLAAWTLGRLAAEAVRTRRLSRRTVMVFALSLPLAGLVLLEGHKAFYESSLVLPFLGFVPALGLRCPRSGKAASVARAASAAVLTISLGSMVTLWATVLPNLPGWLSRGYVPRQRLSISAFGAADARDQVRTAARLCGIDPSHTMDHLVVDSLTYTAFDNLREPYFALYTFDPWRDDVRRLLAARGSAGMVVSCGAVPRPLLRRTRRFGPLCCMPPFALAKEPQSGYILLREPAAKN